MAENLTGWYPALVGGAVLGSQGPDDVAAAGEDDDDTVLLRSFIDDVIAAAKPKDK